ncbi:MAG: hypothetical protein RMJ66_06080, partial [Bacteroidia bacterium]|nr:hypothetical protein [Bacteroidia bacterium]MDW8134619.1 hypothetical protein [Bacteroidia bacterium]
MRNWQDFLLRGRYVWVWLVAALSVYMAWKASGVEITQDFVKVIPETDLDYIAYKKFQRDFGEDAGIILLGLTLPENPSSAYWQGVGELTQKLWHLKGVSAVLGLPTAPILSWQGEKFKLDTLPLPYDAKSWDSLRQHVPLYQGFLWDKEGRSVVIYVQIDSLFLHSRAKHVLIEQIEAEARQWGTRFHSEVHISGVPYLRHYVAQLLPKELWLFITASLLLTIAALWLYFRSWYAA